MVGGRLAQELIGRDHHLDALRQSWRGSGEVVCVRGVAGVGKSRIVRQLAREVVDQQGRVFVGRCSNAGVEIALRPITELLLGAMRAGIDPPPSMASFVPALARLVPAWGTSDGADPSPLVLGEALLRFVSSVADEDAPALIVVEDVHWADLETVAVLDFLADAISDHPVVLVLTCREPSNGAGADLVDRMLAERRARPLDVGPLGEGDVAAMAASCLGGSRLPDEIVSELVARSDGVPFLVEELLSTAADVSEVGQVMPASVAASVQVRLAGLTDQAARIALGAAMLGRQFDWEVVAAINGLATTVAADPLRDLITAQLLERDGAGYRFRHALTRDAVLAEVRPHERAGLATALLDALEQHDPSLSDDRLIVAADLAEQAQQSKRAVMLIMRAAQQALDRGSLVVAEVLGARGRALACAAAPDLVDHAEELLMTIWTRAGKPELALATGSGLRERATDPERSAVLSLALATAAIDAGRWSEGEQHLDAARLGARPRDLARIDVLAAQAALARDDVTTALQLAGAVIDVGTPDDPVSMCEALEILGRVERLRDMGLARRAFERARDTARQHDLRLCEIRAMQELGTIDLYSTLERSGFIAARGEAVDAGAISITAVIDLQLAALYGERIELDDAVAAARRCVETSRLFGLPTLAMGLALEACAHGKAGRYAEMHRAAREARAVGSGDASVEAALCGNAEASYHLHRGDLTEAHDALGRSIAYLRRSGAAGAPFAGVWSLLSTLLDFDDEAARDEVRAMPLDTPMSRAMVVAADAVAAGRHGDRVGAATCFATADDMLAPYQRGYRRYLMRWLVAPAAVESGWGEPEAWLRQSLAGFDELSLPALARSCRSRLQAAGFTVPRQGRGDAPVPAELAALGITSRELDVLRLLSEGRSNRSIAECLHLSPRTVEKHVERLVMKAGMERGRLGDLLTD